MKRFVIGTIVGMLLGGLVVAAQELVTRIPEITTYPITTTPAMPGGIKPDGRVYFLQLDQDGYVLATCRKEQQ